MAAKHIQEYRNGFTGFALCGSGSREFTSPKNFEDVCERCQGIWNREVLPAQGGAAMDLALQRVRS